jgi:hypothetical protein
MKRGRLNLLTALSLLLCAALGVLWVRSYWCVERVVHLWRPTEAYPGGGAIKATRIAIGHYPGRLLVSKAQWVSSNYTPWFYEGIDVDGVWERSGDWPSVTNEPYRERFSIRYLEEEYDGGGYRWEVIVPYYVLTLVTGVPACLWTTRRLWRRKMTGRGLCPSCGYDLRATPGRCPECGRVPTASGP